MKIVIVLYDEVEVLDACGPFEVFSVANRVHDPAPFEVVLAAADPHPVRLRGGLEVLPHRLLSEVDQADVLLVPGGVTAAAERDSRLVDWLAARAGTPVVASVCTGVFLLATAGLVTTQRVTTHWDDLEELRRRWPTLTVVDDVRWVRDGDVYTSAGISAGIDLALHLVATLVDRQTAVDTARMMDYAWEPTA